MTKPIRVKGETHTFDVEKTFTDFDDNGRLCNPKWSVDLVKIHRNEVTGENYESAGSVRFFDDKATALEWARENA
ncbi:MAG TPA: hypothetical protein VKA31_00345 [Mariprofundaceae bacterium]|nr:hypothetical protein [Mariprofundaceae bacterium]